MCALQRGRHARNAHQHSGSPTGSTTLRSKTSTSSKTVVASAASPSSPAASGDAELGWKYAKGSSADPLDPGVHGWDCVGLGMPYLEEKLSAPHDEPPCRHDSEVWRCGPREQLFTAFALLRNCSFCCSSLRTSSCSFSTSSSALVILLLPMTSAIIWGLSTSASIW